MAISKAGDYENYSYTGGVQAFTAPIKAVYKLEVWGAGAVSANQGGLGGYSVGYVKLAQGEIIYICVGGAGSHGVGGYNGGGYGTAQNGTGGGGGGATHMARASGVLSSVSKANLLIAAGGGGGGTCVATSASHAEVRYGGNGGGLEGTNGQYEYGNGHGTQTSGYAYGQGENGGTSTTGGGGGGGYYGGYAGTATTWDDQYRGGGGGSGYIDGVPAFTYKNVTYAPSTSTGGGAASGANGSARITAVVRMELPVIFNGTAIERLFFGGVEALGLVYNGTKIFMRRWRGKMRRRGAYV